MSLQDVLKQSLGWNRTLISSSARSCGLSFLKQFQFSEASSIFQIFNPCFRRSHSCRPEGCQLDQWFLEQQKNKSDETAWRVEEQGELGRVVRVAEKLPDESDSDSTATGKRTTQCQ